MLRILALIVAGCLLSAASCRTDEREGVLPAPIQVTFTVPSDSAQNVSSDRFISIDFQRQIRSTSEIELTLFPRPQSTGEKRLTLGGQNLTWFDVVAEANSKRQHLLIDGPNVLHPYIVGWFTPHGDIAEFQGTIRSPIATHDVRYAVIFTISLNGGWTPSDASSFAMADIRSMALPYPLGDPVDEADYRMPYMPAGVSVYVVAILDTSGNGVHDPREDWWGYYKQLGSNSPSAVEPGTLLGGIPSGIDIELRAP